MEIAAIFDLHSLRGMPCCSKS